MNETKEIGHLVIAIDLAQGNAIQVCSEYKNGKLVRQWAIENTTPDAIRAGRE